MTLVQACFLYCAAVIVILSLLVVSFKNPLHSIILMLVLFIHIAILYLFLNAEFMAAIQIIVYAGSVLVLYLFVVMLLNIKEEEKKTFHDLWYLSIPGAALFLFVFIFTVKDITVIPETGPYTIEKIKEEGSLMILGKVLFTDYILPFEVVSLILLVAIIGAVVLAKRQV
jgi:NADH-quinone oxidoreductase subunit J